MCPALVCRVGTKKPWASITLREPGNIRALGYTLGISFSTFIEQLLYIHIRQVSDNKMMFTYEKSPRFYGRQTQMQKTIVL